MAYIRLMSMNCDDEGCPRIATHEVYNSEGKRDGTYCYADAIARFLELGGRRADINDPVRKAMNR